MNSSIIEGSSRFVNGKIPGEARRPGSVNEGEKQLEIGRKVAYNDAVNRSYVHPNPDKPEPNMPRRRVGAKKAMHKSNFKMQIAKLRYGFWP